MQVGAIGNRLATRRRLNGLAAQAATLGLIALLSGLSLHSYYTYYQKEQWSDAASYVAERIRPGELILFNATWVQIPFDYYFRHFETGAELRGLPTDLFGGGNLEPAMTAADVPRLRQLAAGRPRVWLVYSHNWYTDPAGIIPAELGRGRREVERQEFVGVQVSAYE